MELLTNPFYEMAFVLLAAAIVGALGLQLRQPLIVTSSVDLILRPFVNAAEQAAEELVADLKPQQYK